MPYIFQEIIVKILVLTDAVLGIFVGTTSYTAGNLANCGGATVSAGSLTDCGNALVGQLGSLIVQGCAILVALEEALRVICGPPPGT